MPEYVYVLTNDAMPGVVKIGFTSLTPEERCSELSAATGVPVPFRVAHSRVVSDGRAAEAAVHRFLDSFRTNASREFFKAPLAKAIAAVDYCCADYPLPADSGSVGVPDPRVVDLIRRGLKINAIKLVRESNPGIGLREAKEIVDTLDARLKGEPRSAAAPPAPAATGCAVALVACLAGSALLGLALLL